MLYCLRLIVKTSLLYALLLISCRVSGQEGISLSEKPQWKIGVSAGISHAKLIDKAYSQLIFAGYAPAFGIDAAYPGNKVEHLLRAAVQKGESSNDLAGHVKVDQLIFSIGYNSMFRLYGSEESGFSILAGPGIQVFYADRRYQEMINRNGSYTNLASLDLSVKLHYNLNQIIRGLRISDHISAPLTGAYSDQTTQDKSDQALKSSSAAGFVNFLRYHNLISIPEMVSLRNSLQLSQEITDQHSIGLTFDWQVYKFKARNQTRQSNQVLSLNYAFNF